MQDDTNDVREELRERREQLDRISSHLNGVWAQYNSTRDNTQRLIDSITEAEHTLATDRTSSRRRLHKRRKLDHDVHVGFQSISYGHYGQVVPGQLKMEIVSCDGGEYSARDPIAIHRENYRAENVLRDDRSVYCTKSSRCNLMLRHQGETLFHLESLVIKAPETGYTAPLQQGLVFVGMSPDKLVAGTSTYHIQYGDVPSRTRSSTPSEASRDRERLPLLDALHDPQIWEASTRNRYVNFNPPYMLPPPRPSASRPRTPRGRPSISDLRYILGDHDEGASIQSNTYLDNCDWPAPESAPSSGLTRAPTPPPHAPFTVTAESDEDGDADSIQTGYLPPSLRRELSSSEDDAEDTLARQVFLDSFGAVRRPARRTSPGRIETREGEDGVLQPHAIFFMGEHRSKITIKFDPPVSGRFLLLKLFSPQLHDGENIDIQYIAVQGYAGPRFFPAIEMK